MGNFKIEDYVGALKPSVNLYESNDKVNIDGKKLSIDVIEMSYSASLGLLIKVPGNNFNLDDSEVKKLSDWLSDLLK